ncbi:MAG: hypothetical protein MUE59_06140 [Thiobacillaceae bacterium]|nr:hypothetical protein [Thiobacillaceae bacterium]
MRRIALEEGVDPDLLLSVWQQEGSGSTDVGLRGPTLPQGHRYAGHYGQGPFQIMSFHGQAPQDFEGQARWAAQHLRKRGVRGYYGQTPGGGTQSPTGMPGMPSTDQYEQQVLGRAGLLQATAEPPAVAESTAPPAAQEPKMQDTELMGAGTIEALMRNPLLLMGASILASNNDRNAGRVIGRGLLGGMALHNQMRQQDSMDQYRKLQMQQMRTPANVQEYEYLIKSGVSPDEARRLAFSGQAGFGEVVRNVGGVNYREVRRPDGSVSMEPITTPEQMEVQRRLAEQKRSETMGGERGKQTTDLEKQINTAMVEMPSMIKANDELIADIRGGKYADTGPIMGRIKEYWDPDLAVLNAQSTNQMLQNLQITNLAPVTIKELELVQQMWAGNYKTPEQNAAVLEFLNQRAKERMRRLKVLSAKMRMPDFKIEDLPAWTESTFKPFEEAVPFQTGGAAQSAPAATTRAMPPKPPGITDADWAELMRLRGITGGF